MIVDNINKIDYSKCPECNSTKIQYYGKSDVTCQDCWHSWEVDQRKRFREVFNLDYPICKPNEDTEVFNGVALLNSDRIDKKSEWFPMRNSFYIRFNYWLIDEGIFFAYTTARQFNDHRDFLQGEVQRFFLTGIELFDFETIIPKYKDQLYVWAWQKPKIQTILKYGEILKLPLMNGKVIKGKNGNILVERSDGSRVVTTFQGIRKYKGEKKIE